jgi:hypothetical protein
MTESAGYLAWCGRCQAIFPTNGTRCPYCGLTFAGLLSDEELRAALQAELGPDHEVGERLARGRMGTVFRVYQRRLDRWVAVKVLTGPQHNGRSVRARFLLGVMKQALINHPNIMRVYDSHETQRLCWMVMPPAPENLAAVLLSEGRFAPREAARIMQLVAEALHAVHETGLVHRDVKPQHILLDRREGRVWLTDFSLGVLTAGGTKPAAAWGEVVGTPAYMSPEQAEGRADLDGRSDLYALGAVGYQLLTGFVPFDGTAEEQLVAHRTRRSRNPATRHPDIPVTLADIVMRCLAKLPANRWQSAAELADALALFRGRPVPARPRPAPVGVRRREAAEVALDAEGRGGGLGHEPVDPPAAAVPGARPTPAPRPRSPAGPVRVPLPGREAALARLAAARARAARPVRFRNAPLWAAGALLLWFVAYCAMR